MAAWGIEELGNDTYKCIHFRYRWQMTEWAQKKPDKRRQGKNTALDNFLKHKAKTTRATTIRDTRRVKA